MKKRGAEAISSEQEPSLGRDELNLAEFPIALLSETIPPGVKSLEFKDQIFDSGKKKLLNRKLTIEGSETYGLPTAKDDEIILGLLQLSKRNGFGDRKVEFSRFELISILGWPNTGQSYARIEKALHRWVGVTLHYENAWWDKSEERWTSGAFHIIDDFELNDSRETTQQMTLLQSRIIWSSRVFESFIAGHLKNIRYDVYVKLKSSVSKRMYRFLDKRFHQRRSCSFDLRDFAHEHIGLSRSYKDCGKLKEKLDVGIRELEAIGFIEPLSREARFEQEGRARWRVHFTRKAESPEPIAEQEIQLGTVQVAELTQRGVSEASALELSQQYPAERIAEKLEQFDFLNARNDPKVSKSPSGYLVKSIRDDYAAPKGFVAKAELERREAARKAEEGRLAAARRAEDAAAARERAERAAIDGHWDALSREQQAELDAAALANADPETLKLAKGPMKRFGIQIIRREFIRRHLQAKGKLPPLAE